MTVQQALRDLKSMREAQGKSLSEHGRSDFVDIFCDLLEDERAWQHQVAPGEIPWE